MRLLPLCMNLVSDLKSKGKNIMDVLVNILSQISFWISIIGIIIISWGVLVVGVQFLYTEYILFKKDQDQKKDLNFLRRNLSLYILLGLEFMVAGDIIHTVLRPSKQDLIILGSIVAIRTVISYFLNKELTDD